MIQWFGLCVLILGCRSTFGDFASFSLLRPNLFDVYTILPPHTQASVAVEFVVYGATAGSTNMCLELTRRDFDSENEVQFIHTTCMDVEHTSFAINNLIPGMYTLIMHLQENGSDLLMSQIRRPFEIRDITQSLPIISATDITAVADRYTNKSDVAVSYSLSPCSLSHLLTVCIDVEDAHAQHMLSSCLSTDTNSVPSSFTLYGLSVGEYSQTLTVALRNSPFTRYESTSVTQHVRVLSLYEALPSITAPTILEAALPRGEHAVDVTIAYRLSHTDVYVLRHAQLCVEVLDKITCSSALSGSVLVPQLPRGDHSYSLEMQIAEEESVLASSTCSGRIVIEAMSTFVPTYTWQQVHAWQAIPAGLLTRLPMGEGGVKEARIPDPWQLQTSLPQGCKGYFLRMDVSPHTLISAIRRRVEELCAAQCVQLIVKSETDGHVAQDNETIEQLDVFNRKLVISSECTL